MFFRVILTVLVMSVACSYAFAQEGVSVRFGDHDKYSRLVFDWKDNTSYRVSRDSAGDISIIFDSNESPDLSGLDTDEIAGIDGVVKSNKDGKLQITLKAGSGNKYRNFTVGNKIVIDIFKTAEQMSASRTVNRQQKAEVASNRGSSNKVTKVEGNKASPPAIERSPKVNVEKSKDKDVKPADKRKDIAAKNKDDKKGKGIFSQKMDETPPHLITMSFTEALGMAVFERSNALWIVMDKIGITSPPQITGPNKDKFPPFKRYEIDGGTAFRMRYPEGEDFAVYAEGGGLLWRVVLSSSAKEAFPARPESVFEKNRPVRGGSIVWPMKMVTKVLELYDPTVGDRLKVVAVEQADILSGDAREYVDFATLPSVVGMAVRPKSDYLNVDLSSKGVEVSRPEGLAISSIRDISVHDIRRNVEDPGIFKAASDDQEEFETIFDFESWIMGGLRSLEYNNRILQSGLLKKEKHGRVQDLITLAKMNLANDRGQEALGFLRYANEEIPGLVEGPEFLALRGASYALSGKYELAFKDLMQPFLKPYKELDIWRAYTLAWLEDWRQAKDMLPEDYKVLALYPKDLLEKVGIKLAEVALRSGDVETSENIMALLLRDKASLKPWTLAAIEYLKGEAHNQSGEYKLASDRWKTLIGISDNFYRIRAGLSLVMLGTKMGSMNEAQAINRLEGLRYLWRGDELEAKTNFMLGQMYIESDKYLKGFGILRDAVSMSPNSDVGQDISAFMSDSFKTLLTEDKDLSPIDAAAIYEEFRELTPPGREGERIVQMLAERLVEADLLDRAADILRHQVDFRLEGSEKGRVALRLAGIYLIDNEAGEAMKSLSVARKSYQNDKKKLHEISLLEARALSELNRTEEAIEMLNRFTPTPEVNLLRADIAWRAGLWEDAEEALKDIILDEQIDKALPLTQYQADLILNRAVALHLAGDRVELANMSKIYSSAMGKTSRARLFELIVRPRRGREVNREMLQMLIDEVDIFKNFLEVYRNFD
jgi:hypothetical protein